MNEEQEMEAEALEAIFDHHFCRVKPLEWTVELFPELSATEPTGDGNAEDNNDENHVACKLTIHLPLEYPETAVPTFGVDIVKGLAVEHVDVLRDLASEEAEANEGAPCIFAVCERLREWLVDNNVKGLDDRSMYSQMVRKQQELKKQEEKKASAAFESQSREEGMTHTELEELAVRKRREEGTPCNTKENFERWKAVFEAEMAAERAALEEKQDNEGDGGGGGKKKGGEKQVDKSGRLTGYQQFSNMASMNLEALEAAAEQAAEQEEDDGDGDDGEDLDDVDQDLFEDDVDLDDLDFDDDDEEDVDI